MSNICLNNPIPQNTQASSGSSASYGMSFPTKVLTKQPQINPLLPQPRIPIFDPSIRPNVPFSARLRYEGLKRGYELLTEKTTPYSIISRGFRFCIFTSTRDQITKHIETLLQSSSLSAFDGLGKCVPVNGNGWSWNMDVEVKGNQARSNISASKILQAKTALPSRADSTSKTVPLSQDSVSNYMDTQAVQGYLVSKGLVIEPSASIIALTRDPMHLEGNMFEEFLGRTGVLLSVDRLLEGMCSIYHCQCSGQWS